MSKYLIAYFSASGVTKKVAEKINSIIDSDIFEIEPKEKYTAADLNWNDKNSRSTIEMNDKSSRPEIKSKIDVSDYDSIIIGFPVWWYTAPTIINTFIEENNVENKDIYVFVTSGGSGVNDSFNNLKNAYPNNKWIKGIRLRGNESDETIKEWIDNN
jgi:flavodoxin